MSLKKHLHYWLAALHLPGVGPRKFMRWLECFTDIAALFHASCDEWQAAGVPRKQMDALQHPDWKSVEHELAWLEYPDHHIICLEDEYYPPLLKEIADPPLVLYVHGNKEVLQQQQIAIVGSRRATPTGVANAEQFAYCLAGVGIAVTSGLALGIDGASHRGALAANGMTIGVAGTGLNHVYPPSHRSLVEKIIGSCGAVVSEFPLRTLPMAGNFPRRNRIIGGLSMGVLVVEAALKSGSLITARLALEQGREVFAIPGSIHHPLAKGCHHLIRQGAKLVETAQDILEEIAAFRPKLACNLRKLTTNHLADLAPEVKQFLDQIGYEITSVDVIILRSGLTASKVSSMLLTLELDGYIQSVPGGYIRRGSNQ